MFQNYFKLAIKVLGRRKFFTFVSLFGISFTLMILTLLTAILTNELGSAAPMGEQDRMVFLPRVSMKKEMVDTIAVIDTVMLDGAMSFDTTFEYKNLGRNMSTSSPSFYFLDEFMRDLTSVTKYSFYSPNHTYDLFLNSNKLTFKTIFTDAAYWQIYNFKFLEGKAYNKDAVNNQERVAVISEKAALQYFGKVKGVVGKTVTLDRKQYQVVGVTALPKVDRSFLNAHVFLPYTELPPKALSDKEFLGSFDAVFVASKPSGRDAIKDEINRQEKLIPMPNPDEYNVLELAPSTYAERYATAVLGNEREPENTVRQAFIIVALLMLFLILLPTLNLININLSRILERSSEIGVRKAFGANSGNILTQFVFENVILTLIGGLIGFILAYIMIGVINDTQALGDTILVFNFKVFLYGLLICLVFGVLSGILPAYRMSKVHIANSLKRNAL